MDERFLIDQITLYLGQHQEFGGKHNEIMAYEHLDQLIALKGLKDREEATDYYIGTLEGAIAA